MLVSRFSRILLSTLVGGFVFSSTAQAMWEMEGAQGPHSPRQINLEEKTADEAWKAYVTTWNYISAVRNWAPDDLARKTALISIAQNPTFASVDRIDAARALDEEDEVRHNCLISIARDETQKIWVRIEAASFLNRNAPIRRGLLLHIVQDEGIYITYRLAAACALEEEDEGRKGFLYDVMGNERILSEQRLDAARALPLSDLGRNIFLLWMAQNPLEPIENRFKAARSLPPRNFQLGDWQSQAFQFMASDPFVLPKHQLKAAKLLPKEDPVRNQVLSTQQKEVSRSTRILGHGANARTRELRMRKMVPSKMVPSKMVPPK